MSDINSIYILEHTGRVIYSCEIYIQGSSEFDSAILSGISNIVKSFNFDFKKKPIEIVEISNNNLIITKCDLSNNIIIVKYNRATTEKKITKDLEKIVKQYQNSFKQENIQNFAKFVNKYVRIDETQGEIIHHFLSNE